MRTTTAFVCALLFSAEVAAGRGQNSSTALQAELNRIFDAPALSRALIAVDVRSLRDARVVYQRNPLSRVIPGSALKIVTVAAAAERLGWNHRFLTTLDAVGSIDRGVLRGDLVVTGGGDPSIGAQDLKGAALFDEWADAVRAAGITRVEGRLIGDDNAFEDEPLGGGWAWDYLSAGYAAPSGALSYNENVVVIRATPLGAVGESLDVQVGPPGHGLTIVSNAVTGAPGSSTALTISRAPGETMLLVGGQMPPGSPTAIRTATIDNPTLFFVDALRRQLAARGVTVTGAAIDVDDVRAPIQGPRRLIARRESEPFSSLAGYAMKVSQNYYAEMFLKALGRATSALPGSAERGLRAVREVLGSWQISLDPLVMRDGSGLSRYDYASAELLSSVLAHAWTDERLRGPFAAALPVGGRDGTLGGRMRSPTLDRQVQAKTGTLDNVRSLAGYLHTNRGETLVFTMIANHFTAPVAEIDAVMERALERLTQ